MARAIRKIEAEEVVEARPRPREAANETPVDSPARQLQEELARAMAGIPAEAKPRWSARQTAAIILIFNGLFWWGLVELLGRIS